MAYQPILRDWELYFDRVDGTDNRTRVATAFAKYWNGAISDLFTVPGKCVLGGRVFGRAGFTDGDEIFTSSLQTIKRVEYGYKNGVPHDLMLATTKSGSVYYFYSDEHNAYMALMLGDLSRTGHFNTTPGYYLKREYKHSRLL